MSEHIYGSEMVEIYGGIVEGKLKRREEIVRCRDCEHYYEGRCEASQWSTSSLMPPHRVEPYGFCYWGERRSDELR